MAVSVPADFPLYRASMAEVIAELDAINADPDLLDLLRAVTWVFAQPAPTLLLSLETHTSTGKALTSEAASGGARELVGKGAGRLSPYSESARWTCALLEGDIEIQVWDEARAVLIDSDSTTAGAVTVVGGTLDLTGYAGLIVRVEVYLRRKTVTDAELYHLVVYEDDVAAGDLPA